MKQEDRSIYKDLITEEDIYIDKIGNILLSQ